MCLMTDSCDFSLLMWWCSFLLQVLVLFSDFTDNSYLLRLFYSIWLLSVWWFVEFRREGLTQKSPRYNGKRSSSNNGRGNFYHFWNFLKWCGQIIIVICIMLIRPTKGQSLYVASYLYSNIKTSWLILKPLYVETNTFDNLKMHLLSHAWVLRWAPVTIQLTPNPNKWGWINLQSCQFHRHHLCHSCWSMWQGHYKVHAYDTTCSCSLV